MPEDKDLQAVAGFHATLATALKSVVVGQRAAIDHVMVALIVGGHVLLTGGAATAKGLLVQCLAKAAKLSFKRIQFTPDLMPSDITGAEILEEDSRSGKRVARFVSGPIFTNLLMADEINRTPPKTQAALLEAMQEKTVTVAEGTHQLEEPFIVLATQNPIEQEGTYPLPEAQLDRFLFQVNIDYPAIEDERRIVAEHSFTPLDKLQPVLSREEIMLFREAVANVPAAPNVVDYAVRLCRATRPGDASAPAHIKEWVRWGASPRASQHLILAGRARAACQGRFNVACEDVAAVALPVLRHRLVRTFRAEADEKTTDDIINQLLGDVPREAEL
jgi:MoxR-like ATPase